MRECVAAFRRSRREQSAKLNRWPAIYNFAESTGGLSFRLQFDSSGDSAGRQEKG